MKKNISRNKIVVLTLIIFIQLILIVMLTSCVQNNSIDDDIRPSFEIDETKKQLGTDWIYKSSQLQINYPKENLLGATEFPYIKAYLSANGKYLSVFGSCENNSTIKVIGAGEDISKVATDGVFEFEIAIEDEYFEFKIYAKTANKEQSESVVITNVEKIQSV